MNYFLWSFFFFFCAYLPIQQVHALTRYVSDEQANRSWSWSISNQEDLAMQIVDLQDDLWQSNLGINHSVYRVLFWSWSDQALGLNPYSLVDSGIYLAEIQRVQMDGPLLWTPNWTATQPKLDSASSLQDSSPFPYSLSGQRLRNETIWWSSSAKNAIRIDVLTWISGFWAWFGDVETRTDGNWTPAEVFVYDAWWDLLGSTVISPTISDQSVCWWDTASSSPSACWNETTRWIWFTLQPWEQAKHILLVVWDDDDPGDWWTNDWNTEHMSMIGPTFVLWCKDDDLDWVCNEDDICPLDPSKQLDIWCWCNIDEPLWLWTLCKTEVNSCGSFWTWTIQCDWTCDAMSLLLPDRYDEVCESEPNECGITGTWNIDCSWSCYAFAPDLPNSYNTSCTSEPNNCWSFATGTIACDWRCNAIKPIDKIDCNCDELPALYWEYCESELNKCWDYWTWIIICDWSCSAIIPILPSVYGNTCLSEPNWCGMMWTWSMSCDWTCNASKLDDSICPEDKNDVVDVWDENANDKLQKGWWWNLSKNKVVLYCWDWRIDNEETCDDSNYEAWDGCDQYCKIEKTNKYLWVFDSVITSKNTLNSSSHKIIEILDTEHSIVSRDIGEIKQNNEEELQAKINIVTSSADSQLMLPRLLPDTWSY